jgi:K+-sensing histidine kinase KdpD
MNQKAKAPPTRHRFPWRTGQLRQILRPVQPETLTSEEHFEYTQFLLRVRFFILIKAGFNILIVILYALVLRPELRTGPILIAVLDGLLILPFSFLVRRWPTLSTYILLSTTALSISAADAASGYQTSTSGILYALLIIGGAVVLIETRGIAILTTLVTSIYLATYALEIFGLIDVEMILSHRAVIRVISLHTMAFISVGVLSNTLIHLYRQMVQTRIQHRLLTTLIEGFQEISGDLHLHTLLQRIVERAVATVPSADRAILFIQEDNRIAVRGAIGYGELSLLGLALPLEMAAPYLERTTIITENLLHLFNIHFPEKARAYQALPPAQTAAVFPLKVKESSYGVLIVINTHAPDAFDQNTHRMMSLLAHQAAVAVENAQLYSESQSRLQEALALNRIGKEITGRLQMPDLILTIYSHIQDAIQAPSFFLATLDAYGDKIILHSPVDDGQILPDMTIHPRGVLGWVIQNRKPLRWGNVHEDVKRYPEIAPQILGPEEPSTRSLLSVPLIVEEQVIGALSAQSPKLHAYNERDEQFLSSLASYVAVAVQNAYLYDQVQQKAQELEQKQAELQNLVATVSQRMMGPVESLNGFTQLLQDCAKPRLTPEEKDYLERVGRNSRWVSQLIQDMLFLAQIDQIEEEVEPIALTTLVRGVSTNLGLSQQGIDLLAQENMPVIYADPVLIWSLFRNLLQNAKKLLRDTPSPTIEVGCETLTTNYRLYVRGNGETLPEESLERVFELFFPVGKFGAEESGMGLTIAHRILQRYHGHIWAEAQEGEGTTFSMLLPKELGHHRG